MKRNIWFVVLILMAAMLCACDEKIDPISEVRSSVFDSYISIGGEEYEDMSFGLILKDLEMESFIKVSQNEYVHLYECDYYVDEQITFLEKEFVEIDYDFDKEWIVCTHITENFEFDGYKFGEYFLFSVSKKNGKVKPLMWFTTNNNEVDLIDYDPLVFMGTFYSSLKYFKSNIEYAKEIVYGEYN